MSFSPRLHFLYFILGLLRFTLVVGSSSTVKSVIDLDTKISKITLTHSIDQVNIYVASTNHLYMLQDTLDPATKTKSLLLKTNLITGPKSQKPQCAFLTSESSADQCIKYICDEDSGSSKLLNVMSNRQQSQLINNENRLLLIDSPSNQLIECGSIDYGGCRLRSLVDLSIIGCNYSAPLIPFSTASGVIVSSTNQQQQQQHSVSSALYLMVSMENDQSNTKLEKSEFPVFSFRNLDSSSSKVHAHVKPQLFQLKYPIEYMNYDQNLFDSDFHMKIKYSFKHNGYIYFLYTITNKILTQSCNKIITQQANNQTDSVIVTRMVRICDTSWTEGSSRSNKRNNPQENLEQLTSHFSSQAATNLAVLGEVAIDCDDTTTGIKHHILQSAFFLDQQHESKLFLTFNTSGNAATSVVCSLNLKKLEDHYSQMLHKCMDGDNSYAELVSPYSNKATWKAPCRCSMITDLWKNMPRRDRLDDRKLFCHNDYFNYLNGRVPLTLNSIHLQDQNNNNNAVPLSKVITSVTVMLSDTQRADSLLVIVLATSDAKLLMSAYDPIKEIAYKYDQIDLLKSHKFTYRSPPSAKKSAALDIELQVTDDYHLTANLTDSTAVKERNLYATFDRFLFKIDLQDCQKFKTCSSCLGHTKSAINKIGNPFCGWCIYTQQCIPQNTCLQDNALLFKKLIFSDVKTLWLNKASFNSECPSITQITPSKYFNPTVLYTSTQETINFGLNVNTLKSGINYFCDVKTNFNQFSARSLSYSTTLSRVAALPNNELLTCNLTLIKTSLQKFIKQVPIEARFANISVEIRASTTSNDEPTVLFTTTNLFAYNCSYFEQCDQCLNPVLNSGCVWCAKNSKCVFNTKLPNALNLFTDGGMYEEEQCPGEVEFYRESTDVCTSFSTTHDTATGLTIPFSDDSNLSKFFQMSVKNRRLSYQSNFKCVFTRTNELSNENGTESFLASNLIWDTQTSLSDYKNLPFDCVFSPYLMQDIQASLPVQTVYMSVWWSSKINEDSMASTRLDSSLNGWHQLQFLSNNNQSLIENNEDLMLSAYAGRQARRRNFIEIKVLSCSMRASSCGECLNQELIDLGCGWCQATSQCSMQKDCTISWINDLKLNYCPGPLITSMTPQCGPAQNAGTQIVITGQNLGFTPDDINVKLAPIDSVSSPSSNHLDCDVIPELYVKASRVVCRSKQIAGDFLQRYIIYIQTNTKRLENIYSSLNKSSEFIFEYITPTVKSIHPQRGIKSGGTLLKLTGEFLACGSSLQIRMAGSVCEIVNMTSETIFCLTPRYTTNERLMAWNREVGSDLKGQFTAIQLRMDDYWTVLDHIKFEYVSDPKISEIGRDRAIASGGISVRIQGTDFENVQSANLVLTELDVGEIRTDNGEDDVVKAECNVANSTLMECMLPELRVAEFSVDVQFNEMQLSENSKGSYQIHVYPDPVFKEGQVFTGKTRIILIEGDGLLAGVSEEDYTVWIGTERKCNITSITMNLIACVPDLESIRHVDDKEISNVERILRSIRDLPYDTSTPASYQVQVQIGHYYLRTIGVFRLGPESSHNDSSQLKLIIIVAAILSVFLFSTMIACFATLKRRQNSQIRQLKRMQNEFENLEMRVARECKEAFTELQMDIGELANTLNQTGAPFHDFQTYCMRVLLPNASETEKYCMTTAIDLRLSSPNNKDNVQRGLAMFSQLILNKNFLLTFISTLESDTSTFLMQDRVSLASYISICLHDHMDYLTDVLFTLLADLIQKTIETKNNPKILLRRNESVAEKMLTNWFAFLLYDFIHNCAGTPLYILFLSIKQQIYKGPVDAFTYEARYSLSEDKLIRQSIDYEALTIRVQLQDLDEVKHQQEVLVKVLSCDTITQAKEKILDAFFKGYPFSRRPSVDDLDLVLIASEFSKINQVRLILYDEDKSCKIDSDDIKRINTLSHYKVANGSQLILISRQSYNHTINPNGDGLVNSYSLLDGVHAKNSENMTLLSKSSKGSSSPPTYSKLSSGELYAGNHGVGVYSAMNSSSVGLSEQVLLTNTTNTSSRKHGNGNNGGGVTKVKKCHLIKSNDDCYSTTTPNVKDEKSPKLVSEVYLTRLLATKGGMQSYVDDFFETVFSTAHGSNVLPYSIKYLFDFLDEQASIHGITDPDTVYTWKSNALPLRFWVNIIKNPDFVFDIHKSNTVDSSLSVIASTFMDSCSQSRLDLNKESPSGKLLFYKEVHKYRKWVESYYSDIKQMPQINQQEIGEILIEESRKRTNVFNKNNALYRLYNDYIKKYRTKLEGSLNNCSLDPAAISINKHLNYRLQQVVYLMDAIEV